MARRDYGVYVIELNDGSLYVGSTAKAFEERLAQHQAGGRLAGKVGRRAFKRLRPDLYGQLPRFPKRHQAQRAERKLTNSLRHRLQTKTLRVFGPASRKKKRRKADQ